MRKWTVYILLVVCLSGCGRGNGNNQNDSSVERVGNNVPVEAIKVEKQNNYESKEYQDIINTKKTITENEEIIPLKPLKIDSIFEIPERVKQQRQPRTTPARDIIVEVFDTIPTNTEIYYYSPRMESKSYSYRKELGSDNNFLDVTDIYNKTYRS